MTIYLDGSLITKNSSELNNNTEIPSKFKLYGTDSCTQLDFRNSATIYGVIYAPQADVVYHNSIDIYGSVIGKTMDFKNSTKLYYDASLRDTQNEIGSMEIDRWKE